MNQLDCDASPDNMLWVMSYEGTNECQHKLPGDWEFGGADGIDPRSDPRWQPTTYTYLGRTLRPVTITQVPRCDHEAVGSHRELIDDRHAEDQKVFYIMAAYPGSKKAVTIYSDIEGATGG